MEKISKDELKKPDAFVHAVEVTWGGLSPYKNIIFAVLGAILVGGIGYSGYSWNQGRKEVRAQAALFTAKKALDETQKSFQVDTQAVMAAEKKNEKPPTPKTKSGDLNQDFGPAVSKLEDVVSQHPGSKAAAMAALDLSSLMAEYKQYDRALASLEGAAKGLGANDLLYGFVYLEIGNHQQLKGSCEQAIGSWKKVSDSPAQAHLHAEALLRQGLCYQSLSQKERAQELLKRVSQDYADSDAGKAAKKYLRFLNNEKA